MGLTTTIARLTVITILITTVASQSYTNHTVGDSAGWLFNATTNTTSANYSDWASTQVFNLGDFLIFNTTTNQTVIHTYNQTTYNSCDSEDALDTDTYVYEGGNEFGKPLTFYVPLTIEGINYFFSDGDDGVQCAQGMAFEINVKHGLGLPPSLNQPPPPPYSEPPSSDTPPSTVPNDQQEEFYNGGLRNGGGDAGLVVLVIFFVGLMF